MLFKSLSIKGNAPFPRKRVSAPHAPTKVYKDEDLDEVIESCERRLYEAIERNGDVLKPDHDLSWNIYPDNSFLLRLGKTVVITHSNLRQGVPQTLIRFLRILEVVENVI